MEVRLRTGMQVSDRFNPYVDRVEHTFHLVCNIEMFKGFGTSRHQFRNGAIILLLEPAQLEFLEVETIGEVQQLMWDQRHPPRQEEVQNPSEHGGS